MCYTMIGNVYSTELSVERDGAGTNLIKRRRQTAYLFYVRVDIKAIRAIKTFQ